MTMKDAMTAYFDRLMHQWASVDGGLPRGPWNPDADPQMYCSSPDRDEYVTWRPIEKIARHDLVSMAPHLEHVHPSIDEYFNTYWFCSLEGQLGAHGISLEPVVRGVELESFVMTARGYAAARGGALDHVPIGIEREGLQVVVENRTGGVFIEDWERKSFTAIAPSLDVLIERLAP